MAPRCILLTIASAAVQGGDLRRPSAALRIGQIAAQMKDVLAVADVEVRPRDRPAILVGLRTPSHLPSPFSMMHTGAPGCKQTKP